jgi:hypothetical protein
MAIAAPDLRYRLPSRNILRAGRTCPEQGRSNEKVYPANGGGYAWYANNPY